MARTTREAMEAVKQQATARPPIVGGATQLEKIDLSECPDVRARAIGAIARNCPDLKDLTLVGCVSVVGDEAWRGARAVLHTLTTFRFERLPAHLGAGRRCHWKKRHWFS